MDPVLFVAVALAVSLSTSVVLATGLFYLGTWSALAAMLLTALATLRDLAWSCAFVGSLERDPEYAAELVRDARDAGLATGARAIRV